MTETPTEPSATPTRPAPKLSVTRLLTDLGPGLIFFVAYQWLQRQEAYKDDAILMATAIFLPFALAAFVYSWGKERRVAPIPALTTAMVLIFSALAFAMHDDTFIKMRGTFIFSLFGVLLIGSALLKRNVLETLFEGAIRMPDTAWHTLAVRAGLFYLALAATNEVLWRTQSEQIWVLFHTWGDVAASLIFWVWHTLSFIPKHAPEFAADRQDDPT